MAITNNHSGGVELVSVLHSIVDLARRIESDENRLADWWMSTGIAEFDEMTPVELVKAGRGEALEQFLQSILQGDRD